jgi:hypothetical protein
VNKQITSVFWLARLRKAIPDEPQIRDVCARCNNGVLSDLDAYICRFFDSTLIQTPLRYERVAFEYDYHLLKRWLLKLSYNSARIHDSRDLTALEAVVPYILGETVPLGRSVQLFVQLMYPEPVPEEDRSASDGLGSQVVFEPTLNRVGHTFFTVEGIGRKLLRSIYLRSFSFYLAFFEPGRGRADQDDFAEIFTARMPETALLRPSKSKIEMLCNGTGAWTSFKSSQSNQVIFDDDA